MIHGILEMTDKTVREVMVPRVDVVGRRRPPTRSPTSSRLIIEYGYSRIPIYEDNIDNIVGVVYAKDLLRHGVRGDDQRPLKAVAREPYFTPEAKHVGELLREMKERKVHMAVVVDEHGGTAGIVTFEDLIEEIVGPIRDEYDMREVEELQIVSDHEVVVSARFPVDDLKEALDLEVADVEADTVGGLVYERARRDPQGRRHHPARRRHAHRRSRSAGRASRRCASRARCRSCATAARAHSSTTASRSLATARRSRLRTLAVSSAHDGRMPTYSDEGIVLRRIDYGETDRILTVLTLEHGKIGVIARGVRKSQSRLASRTDLFTRSRMQLARGRGELDVLTQAETVAATPLRQRRPPRRMRLAVRRADRPRAREPPRRPRDLRAGRERADGVRRPGPRSPRRHRVVRAPDGGPARLRAAAASTAPAASAGSPRRRRGSALPAAACSARAAPRRPRGGGVLGARHQGAARGGGRGRGSLWLRLRLDAATLQTLERIVESELAHHLDRRLRSIDVLRAIEGRGAVRLPVD